MKSLTRRQAEVLKYLEEQGRRGLPPTIREIQRAFKFSAVNTVQCHLRALERKGRITRDANLSRGIRLTEKPATRPGIPIVGRVAAGVPILAEQNIEGYLSPGDIVGAGEDCFCLSVVGDSMKDEGIVDGGYVVVRPKPDFENGETGVAVIDGEATVKKLRRQGRMIELIPANERYEKQVVDPAQCDFRYAGKVVSAHRMMK